MSIRGVLLLAFSNLKWNSFPSKNCHGPTMFQGIGAPQTSLANVAVSTPAINNPARATPRGWTDGSCNTQSSTITDDDAGCLLFVLL